MRINQRTRFYLSSVSYVKNAIDGDQQNAAWLKESFAVQTDQSLRATQQTFPLLGYLSRAHGNKYVSTEFISERR